MNIIDQLLVLGATRRLEELNKERDYLIKLIERKSTTPIIRLDKSNKRKWSAAQRAKFMATMKRQTK